MAKSPYVANALEELSSPKTEIKGVQALYVSCHPQLSKKLRSFLDRDGCLSFLKAFASI